MTTAQHTHARDLLETIRQNVANGRPINAAFRAGQLDIYLLHRLGDEYSQVEDFIWDLRYFLVDRSEN